MYSEARGLGPPAAGGLGGCEPTDMVARDRKQVLCESPVCSSLLSHFSNPCAASSVGAGDPNPGPQAGTAHPSPTEHLFSHDNLLSKTRAVLVLFPCTSH